MKKPFWRQQCQCYYFKDEAGKFVRLDPDETKAMILWTAIIEGKKTELENPSIFGVCHAFLKEHKPTLTEARYKVIETVVGGFIAKFGADARWDSITPGGFTEWLKEPKDGPLRKNKTRGKRIWSKSRKRDVSAFIKRIFRWAHQERGMIHRNPLASLTIGRSPSRKFLLQEDIHRKFVMHCRVKKADRPFATYLIASRCGARPQQIREVTAAHVVEIGEHLVWQFDEHKTAEETESILTVYLNPCLQTLTKILMARRSNGPLFCNQKGEKWKKDSVCIKFRRIREKLGVDPKVVAYSYRHKMATDALKAGIGVATVAALLGHASTRMVCEVYGHLDQELSHLANAAANAAKNRLGDKAS